MKTDATIAADLRHIAHTHQPVELLNVYEGLPVLYKAEVLKVGTEPDHALIRFSSYEAVCLTLNRRTTLLTELLAGPVDAGVQACDLAAGTATLDDFRYARGRVGDRLILRVTPSEPLPVRLTSSQLDLGGLAVDLSLSGLGVTFTPPGAAATLRRQAPVQVKLKIEGTPLELPGTVRYVRLVTNTCRVGITLVPTPEARVLFQYLHARHDAILKELQERYQAALKK